MQILLFSGNQPSAHQTKQYSPHTGYGAGLEDDEVQLREQHSSFRMGAGQRLQRSASKAAAAGGSNKKGRRRWMDNGDDDAAADVGDVADLISARRPDTTNTGHIVRMRRGEAWSKFLAYEGCCQVCVKLQWEH